MRYASAPAVGGITRLSASFTGPKAHRAKACIALAAVVTVLCGCTLIALSQVPVRRDGDVLVDAEGMTLYTFDRDLSGKSACNARCAADWRPVVAEPGAKPGGDYTILSRDDGRRQWAYKGKPLYVWSKDEKPVDRTGDAFDNVWRVARP